MNRLPTLLNRYALPLLLIATLLYALIFAAAALYKYHSFWMGFDLAVHEQVLWNTIHGRIAEISPKGATHSYLGVDIILTELLLAPLYALLPRTETMLVLQIILASSGSIPLYLLARDRAGMPAYGLLAAFLYVAALPVQYAILYEFQIRTVGTVLFLWAFLFFERKQFVPFLLAGLFAIWTRSDGSFALAAMGVYALIHRRPWPWSIVPMVVGMCWLVLCMKVLIPTFRADHGFLYGFVYSWLGEGPMDMLRTLLTRPGYVAAHVFTPEKLRYLLHLFAPLLFLPLLRADILLIALPSLMLNLLSQEHIHWSVRYHYQAFIVPFLLIATVYALIDLRRAGARNNGECRMENAECRAGVGGQGSGGRGMSILRWQSVLIGMLLLVTLAAQVVVRSPLIHLVTRSRDAERIAYAHTLIAAVPPDAPLTVTSSLGAHMARRRQLYFFPGNIIYPPAFVERGEYLLADLHEVGDDLARLRQLQQSDRWHTLVAAQDFVLLKKVVPEARE